MRFEVTTRSDTDDQTKFSGIEATPAQLIAIPEKTHLQVIGAIPTIRRTVS